MKKTVLAAMAAAALGVSLLGAVPSQAAQLTPRDQPSQMDPPGVSSGPDVSQVTVTWALADDSENVDRYRVQYRFNTNNAQWQSAGEFDAQTTQTTVSNLASNKAYVFEVAARSGNEWSDWSDASLPVFPQPGAGEPSNIQTTPAYRSMNLTWTPPNPTPDGYEIQYLADMSGATWQPTPLPYTSQGPAIRVEGLDPTVRYFFQVRSVNGENDKSDWVQTTTSVAPLSTPGAPSNVKAVAGDGSAVVSWAAPYPAPGGYELQYKTTAANAQWGPATALTTTSTSYNVTGLSNGTGYFFRVRSVRDTAVSDWTETTTAVTPAATWTVPSAPVNLVALPGDATIWMTWQLPSGSPSTGYEVQYSTNNTSWGPTVPISTRSTATNYAVSGLSNNTPYYVRVRTVNGPNVSGWTQTTGTVTPLSVPGAPTNVTGIAGFGTVNLSWTPPVGSTSHVTGYRIQYSSNGGGTWVAAPDVTSPVTSSTILGLTNGTGYIFRVQATSSSGLGSWSANSGIITPPGAPGAPINVVAVAGNAQATIAWSPPSGPQANPIVAYRVTSIPDSLICTTSAVPPATPATTCTIKGLTNGLPYRFTVVAISAVGTSPSSDASAPVTPTAPNPTIRITDSGRNGKNVFASGTTQGLDGQDTLTALVKTSSKGKFQPAGEVSIRSDGTFRWTTANAKKVWIRFTDGDVVSNTVIVNAR